MTREPATPSAPVGATDPGTGPSRDDFASSEAPRWCPGCGDFSVIAQLQRTLADLGQAPDECVFVSGIGCSSRLPYYMNTHGFHGIHGRAPAIATGLKVARPDLSVWVITGDGDALSIGGNHILHAMRRNAAIKVLMLNNRIYGLTKGQVSPTSQLGQVTKSTPHGSTDHPMHPLAVALAAEASFVARAIDVDGDHLRQTLRRAGEHRGSAFVEVLQNCAIYNDGAWREISAPDVREDRVLRLEHGAPMLFGRARDRGLRIRDSALEVVQLTDGRRTDGVLVHDERADDVSRAFLLSHLWWPAFPVPVGVLRAVERATHDGQSRQARPQAPVDAGSEVAAILRGTDTWQIGGQG